MWYYGRMIFYTHVMIYSLMNVTLLLMIQFFIPFQPSKHLFCITFLNFVSFGVLIATKTSTTLDFHESWFWSLIHLRKPSLTYHDMIVTKQSLSSKVSLSMGKIVLVLTWLQQYFYALCLFFLSPKQFLIIKIKRLSFSITFFLF